MPGLGNNLNELKLRIQKSQEDLVHLGIPEPTLPEMINTTNILRVNEYLTKSDKNKTNLISAYEEYTKQLETSLLSIQSDLRDIIKTKASIIGKTTKKKPRKTRKKTKKKTRK
jgi:hypothetical protein